MAVGEIIAKTILRKHKRMDSWFVSRYSMNLYRGCVHNCVYCDGRADRYYVEGEFGCDVAVKANAIEVLVKELRALKRSIPPKPGYILVGGGVGDGYQPVEAQYQLTRRILQVLLELGLPAQVLTKSTMVERDLDIIKDIHSRSGAIVNFSFSSMDERISSVFEPGVPAPAKRLKAIETFKNAGIPCGIFLMPVIPFITDTPDLIEDSVKKAKDAGVDFIIFSGMTLKEGKQKDYFMKTLRVRYPELVDRYGEIYTASQWGEASKDYYDRINRLFYAVAKKHKMPVRIPLRLFGDKLSENDLVTVMLEHMDHILKTEGKSSPYGYASYSISQLKGPLSAVRGELQGLKGVRPVTADIIKEILDTGTCSDYERLMI